MVCGLESGQQCFGFVFWKSVFCVLVFVFCVLVKYLIQSAKHIFLWFSNFGKIALNLHIFKQKTGMNSNIEILETFWSHHFDPNVCAIKRSLRNMSRNTIIWVGWAEKATPNYIFNFVFWTCVLCFGFVFCMCFVFCVLLFVFCVLVKFSFQNTVGRILSI